MDEESKVLLTSIANKVDSLDKRMSSFEGKMTSVEGKLSSVEGRMSALEDIQTKTLAKVIDIDERLKTDYVTKDELHAVEDRIITHIDGFIKMHEKIDVEQVSLRGAYDRHEVRITKLEKEKIGA